MYQICCCVSWQAHRLWRKMLCFVTVTWRTSAWRKITWIYFMGSLVGMEIIIWFPNKKQHRYSNSKEINWFQWMQRMREDYTHWCTTVDAYLVSVSYPSIISELISILSFIHKHTKATSSSHIKQPSIKWNSICNTRAPTIFLPTP